MTRIGWLLVRIGFLLIGRGGGVGLCPGCGPQKKLDEDGCCSCGADALHFWHVRDDA